MAEADDFNRLYERLVVRRATKKKRVKRATAAAPVAPPVVEDEAAAAKALEAARREAARREKQRQHEEKVAGTVRRLCLARNLRGLARWSRCSAQRLAFRLCDATEQSEQGFLDNYRRLKRQHVKKQERSRSILERCMRMEHIAARLYLCRTVDFQPAAATTMEGRPRVMDEILLFSPPSALIQSQIGYAGRGNVVPPPPPRHTSSG
ncbi:uncharacterized protein IUM83_00431 [Phytophthora cinnamomi]|uniref:uncharacterized protein n=1 Tax=Phytophthora cinnamomi TaxID=4785 RepID=UPI00355A1469|nr:hypothetical protein IUM83_00431 [Phytophthora cinnamomi]